MHARRPSLAALPVAALLALAACENGVTAPTFDGAPRAALGPGIPPSPTNVDVVVPTDPQPLTPGGTSVDVSVPYVGDTPTSTTLSCDGGAPGATYASFGVAGGTCTYAQPGVYSPTITLTDEFGTPTTHTSSTYVVVYDAGNGFVTGGGWIIAPAGSYVADPSLSGRANFGFVSKYLKGASIPTGETEFQFQLGSIDFHSTSYQWLVVSNGRAQYKGEGTINRRSGYGFLLTAIDGRQSGLGKDRFRIKIWDKNAGDAIVFDNQFGQTDGLDNALVLAGGSISIKK